MAAYDFDSTEFDEAVAAAGHKAFLKTLASGRPVFYIDSEGLNVMEYGDGGRYEIRWIPGAPSGENFGIVRDLKASAA